MSNEIKAIAFAEKHNLGERIKLSEQGIFSGLDDLYETIVLEGAGIDSKAEAKREKLLEELTVAVTHVTGTKAAEHFKANPEQVELGFAMGVGKKTTVSGVFNHTVKDHTIIAIETKHQTADMKRVLTNLGDLFGEINS